MTAHTNDFTICEAQPADDAALRRLAALDSSRVPNGRLLVAEADGELVAAVPLAGGPTIADPFRCTAAIVSLPGLRAAQLRGLTRGRTNGRRRRRWLASTRAQPWGGTRPARLHGPCSRSVDPVHENAVRALA